MKRLLIIILSMLFICDLWSQTFPNVKSVSDFVTDSIKHRPDKINANTLNKAYNGVITFLPDIIQDTTSVSNPQHGWLRFQRKDSAAYVFDTIPFKRWRKYALTGTDSNAVKLLINNNSIVKNTIAQLRALTSVVSGQLFYLNDPNIGGTYYWDQTDVTSADNGLDILVTAGNQRLKSVNLSNQFTSIAAMRASNQYQRKFPVYQTLSYYGDGDVASMGFWRYVDTSTHADDSCLFIKPANTTVGRFVYMPINGIYNLKAMGCKPDNSTDISWRANYVMSTLSAMGVFGANVKLPYGTYKSNYTINIPSTAIRFFGDGIHGTTINFPASMIGIDILKQNSLILQHGFQTVEELFINANAKDGTDGVDQYGVGSSPYFATWWKYHGIFVENESIIKNVYVANFSGAGVYYRGSLAEFGSSCSAAYAENLYVKQCAVGVVIRGGDANGIQFVKPDFRDMPGPAFYDSSAFGMGASGGELHACGTMSVPGYGTMGYYVQWSLSGMTGFYTTYMEGGSGDSKVILGRTAIYDGNHGTRFYGTWVQRKEGAFVDRQFTITEGRGTVEGVGTRQQDTTLKAMMVFFTKPNIGQYEGLSIQNYGIEEGRSIYSNNWHWQVGQAGNTIPFAQMFNFDDKYNAIRGVVRGIRDRIGGFALTRYYLAENFIQTAPNTNTTSIAEGPYRVGDVIRNSSYAPNLPPWWTCTAAGSTGSTGGLSGKTGAASNKIVLNGSSPYFQEGDVLSIGGNQMTVTAKNNSEDTLTVTPAPPTISSFSIISYVAPVWSAGGQGFGNTASRPTLGINDKGFWYYDTDLSSIIYWSGTAWVTSLGGGGGITGMLYLNNGATVNSTPRPTTNFIPGTNVTISPVDNSGANRVDVTINAAIAATANQLVYGTGSATTSSANNTYDGTIQVITGSGSANPGGYQKSFQLKGTLPALNFLNTTNSTQWMFAYDESTNGQLLLAHISAANAIDAQPMKWYKDGSFIVNYGFHNNNGYGAVEQAASTGNWFFANALKADRTQSGLNRTTTDIGSFIKENILGDISFHTGIDASDVSAGVVNESAKKRFHIAANGDVYFDLHTGSGNALHAVDLNGKSYRTTIDPANLALLNAAAFTSSPTAPTPTTGDNTTKVATTAFVANTVSQGTYTPTVSNTTNVTTYTAYAVYYTRIGNYVSVDGQIDIQATAAATNTYLQIDIPIAVASNFSSRRDATGVVNSEAYYGAGVVYGYTASQRVEFSFQASGTATKDYHFHYSYLVY